MSHVSLQADDIVALYRAIRTELDATPLLEALAVENIPTALPVVIAANAPLLFRAFSPGDPLIKGAFGVETPPSDAPIVVPTIVIVPLLGFTSRGDRLGYGGGYYDRTLAALRRSGAVLAVGFAFAAQEVDALPASALDERLDWIVTEEKVIEV